MSFSRRAIRMRIYAGVSGTGFARTADSVDVDGINDAGRFQDADAGEGEYSRGWQYRPGQVDPNRVKQGSGVTGAKWTQSQAPYAGAGLSDTAYEGLGLVHPDILNDIIRLALHDIFFETYWPLGWALDNDFSGNVYDWGALATDANIDKVSVGGVYSQNGQSGTLNLKVTTTNPNGFAQGSSLFVTPGDVLFHGAIGRAFDGDSTGAYRLWDADHDVELESVQFTNRAFQKFQFETTIPAGCTEVYQVLEGIEDGAITEWDCLFGHLLGAEQRQVIVPSWITERWRLLGFGPAEYGRAIATDIYNAASRTFLNWKEATTDGGEGDFRTFPLTEEADPFILQVNRPAGLGQRDYWIHGLRPYSDITELLNEDALTNAPEELLMTAVYYRLFAHLHMDRKDSRGESEWQQLRDDYYAELLRRRQFGGVQQTPAAPAPVAAPQATAAT